VIQQLRTASERHHADMQVVRQMNHALNERSIEQTQTISSLESKLADKESEIAQLQRATRQALRRLERKGSRLAEQRTQIESLAADLLAAQRSESEQRARAAQAELLEGAGQKLEARLRATQARLRREEESGTRTANELVQAQAELHRVRAELEAAGGDCRQHSAELAALKEEFAREMAALTDQNKALRAAAEGRDAQATLAALRGETVAAIAADADARAKEIAELKQFALTLQAQIDRAHAATAEILANGEKADSDDVDDEGWLEAKDVMEKIADACEVALDEV
jgi:chromosome segregation ATPase